MGIKKFKPATPTQRWKTVLKSSEITTETPEKSLLVGKKRTSGRNHHGRITTRRRGGGHKRRYRIVDFLRDKWNVPGRVESIQYDPNRSANVALIVYTDGERRYILAPEGLSVGQTLVTAEKVELEYGNVSRIGNLPIGTNVHNVELTIGRGGQIARSAGSFVTISGRDKGYTIVKLPSGEVRKINDACLATIGIVGNGEHEQVHLGKAGRTRWLGRRPSVRGVAMNPVDHPLGGGEGRSSGGRHPVTPWGKPTRGAKTRNKRKTSSRFIISKRK